MSNKFKEANIQQAVILCGGLGTRLRSLANLSSNKPKNSELRNTITSSAFKTFQLDCQKELNKFLSDLSLQKK